MSLDDFVSSYQSISKEAKATTGRMTRRLQEDISLQVEQVSQGNLQECHRVPPMLKPLPKLNLQALHQQVLILQVQPAEMLGASAESQAPTFDKPALRGFSSILGDRAAKQPKIFAVVEADAPANAFFKQLDVSEPAEIEKRLEHQTVVWGGGRVACLGIILHTAAQVDQIQKLLKQLDPPVEPILTLIVSAIWHAPDGQLDGQVDMTIPAVMRNTASDPYQYLASNVEVCS